MQNLTSFLQVNRHHLILSILILTSLITMACPWDNLYNNNPAELEGATPIADISSGLVMNGTATITKYFQETCTLNGSAVLTVNSDRTFVLEVISADVDGLCVQSGDQVIDKVIGKVDTSVFAMYFTKCNADQNPSSDSGGSINNVDARGDVLCLDTELDGKLVKFLKISFDVKK
jgi:hypothetical protein